MSASQINWLLSNYSVPAGTVFTPEVEFNALETAFFEIQVENLTGAPTTGSLAAKFQISPIEYRGYNLDWTTTGDPQAWQDVVAADGFTGHLLIDGAWPAALADQTFTTVVRSVSRRILVPPNNCLIRLALTSAFTGGAAPAFKVTVNSAVQVSN